MVKNPRLAAGVIRIGRIAEIDRPRRRRVRAANRNKRVASKAFVDRFLNASVAEQLEIIKSLGL